MRARWVGFLFLLVACHGSAAPPSAQIDAGACTSPDFAGSPLGVHCNALVDAEGRTVLLHGVNARVSGIFDVTFTDGRAPVEAVPDFTQDDANGIRAVGFNALRLPLDWSGLEPTATGGFDDTYLDRVAAVVGDCAAAGLYVLLDFHQDAYSKEIGEDGAPLWAIVPPPTQLLGGPLTDLSQRELSAQVQAAYETFFGQSSDGMNLQSRFTAMASHVAARFATDPTVIGFELYNEPPAAQAALVALYDSMIEAMRAAAPTKLLFFEPSATRNILDRAPLGPGSLGAGTVYAPHVYTFVFTGDAMTLASITKDQLRPSNQSARAEADSWQAPLVVTEYGFGPSQPNFAQYVGWQNDLEDEVLASSFFWLWKEESQGAWGFFDVDPSTGAFTERQAVVAALSRVRLEAASGRLLQVAYDATNAQLSVQLVGDANVKAPNVISIAGAPGFAGYDATCDGAGVAHDASDPVSIPCGGPGVHTLVLRGR